MNLNLKEKRITMDDRTRYMLNTCRHTTAIITDPVIVQLTIPKKCVRTINATNTQPPCNLFYDFIITCMINISV